jgi:hypothetical protein
MVTPSVPMQMEYVMKIRSLVSFDAKDTEAIGPKLSHSDFENSNGKTAMSPEWILGLRKIPESLIEAHIHSCVGVPMLAAIA